METKGIEVKIKVVCNHSGDLENKLVEVCASLKELRGVSDQMLQITEVEIEYGNSKS